MMAYEAALEQGVPSMKSGPKFDSLKNSVVLQPQQQYLARMLLITYIKLINKNRK